MTVQGLSLAQQPRQVAAPDHGLNGLSGMPEFVHSGFS
jgi:hypothetical protein